MGKVERFVADPEYKPNGGEVASIETSKGTVKVELFWSRMPAHGRQFRGACPGGVLRRFGVSRPQRRLWHRGRLPNDAQYAAEPGVYGGSWRHIRRPSRTAKPTHRIKDEWGGNPLEQAS